MVLPFLAAAAPFAPLIGAAVSAIGGLFSSGDSKNRVDYKQMVKDAEEAGFNPLTVLRNGGSAGYQQTHAPALSAFGGALQTMGQGIAAVQWDPQADVRAKAEFDLVQAQIANLNADTQTRSRSFNVPTYQGSTTAKTDGPWQMAEPAGVVGVRMGGFSLTPDTGWSNAQEVEDRMGEPISWLYGVGVTAADLYNSLIPQSHRGGVTPLSQKIKDLQADRKRVPQTGYVPGPTYSTGGGF